MDESIKAGNVFGDGEQPVFPSRNADSYRKNGQSDAVVSSRSIFVRKSETAISGKERSHQTTDEWKCCIGTKGDLHDRAS